MAISVTSIMCAFIRGVQFSRNPSGPGADSFAMQLIPEDRLGLIRKAFTGSIAAQGATLPDKDADEIIARALKGMPTATQVLGRSAYVESELEAFVVAGGTQYVILGAGLDSYALRKKTSSGVKVFEIDRRETQDFKKNKSFASTGLFHPIRNAFPPTFLWKSFPPRCNDRRSTGTFRLFSARRDC